MQGQLSRPVIRSYAPLDAFLAGTLPAPPGGRALRLLSWAYLAFQSLLLLIVSRSDGEDAFLEGATARGFSVILVLQALPLAMALARAGDELLDEGLLTLAEQRGYPREAVRRRAIYAPLRALLVAMGPALLALGLWPLLLSLGVGPARLLPRVGVTWMLCALALLAGAALLGLGRLLGRLLGPRGSWALLALVVVPWSTRISPGKGRSLTSSQASWAAQAAGSSPR